MPYTVRIYKDTNFSTWEDHNFDTLEAAQSQIWGRDFDDPYNNDDRPLVYGEFGYDIFDPDGICVDTHWPTRIGQIKA